MEVVMFDPRILEGDIEEKRPKARKWQVLYDILDEMAKPDADKSDRVECPLHSKDEVESACSSADSYVKTHFPEWRLRTKKWGNNLEIQLFRVKGELAPAEQHLTARPLGTKRNTKWRPLKDLMDSLPIGEVASYEVALEDQEPGREAAREHEAESGHKFKINAIRDGAGAVIFLRRIE